MEDVIIPVALFAIAPVIVGLVTHQRTKRHRQTTELMQRVVEKGDTLTPDIIHSLGIQPMKQHGDLRVGLILIALALATILFGGAIPDDDAGPIMRGIAMFPLLVGLAYTGFWVFISRMSAKD